MFSFRKKRPRRRIAAETKRFEVAFSIPRQRFLKQDMIGAPWWNDGRFKTEAEALNRYNKLVSCVSYIDGEVAVYLVISVHGETSIKELLIHYSGKSQAPLLRRVLPITLDVKNALAEIELSWEKRIAAQRADSALTLQKKPNQIRPRIAPQKRPAWPKWFSSAVAAVIAAAFVAWLGFVASYTNAAVVSKQTADDGLLKPLPSRPSAYSVLTQAQKGVCDELKIENDSGKILAWRRNHCGSDKEY